MTRFFHGLALFVTLACFGVLGNAASAKAPVGADLGRSAAASASRATVAKTGRRIARRKAHRATARPMAKRRAMKRRMTSRPLRTTMTAFKAVKSAPDSPIIAHSDAPGESLPKPAQVAEAVDYRLAGYTVTTDGAPARMWYSRDYTVKSPYAYMGQMEIDGQAVHVWMETTGNLLASAALERDAAPLPDIAALMERFPDGGLGVAIAGPDDFAPPSEPAVEVVEFTEPSR
ncbi:MAG: hypothetical protein CFK52_04425 [Chloracidobacterium sp. CP2_5A]|nr:MAG: hypothetical protein CFK52_04425 [Chloracidobacterium sp. CP2_5A]